MAFNYETDQSKYIFDQQTLIDMWAEIYTDKSYLDTEQSSDVNMQKDHKVADILIS